ncbi:MAG TPA: Hsp20 family protein [Solirubrobacterales bacterium]
MTGLIETFGPLLDFPLRALSAPDGPLGGFVPATEVAVTDEEVVVVMDVPGFKREDLDIEFDHDYLVVRGERVSSDEAGEDAGRSRHRSERAYGKFERALRLPAGLEHDAVRASLEDGVLTVRIPRPEAQKPHRIEIKTVAADGANDSAPIETEASG